jgi:glycosyltransferase involved in cell wall biosynthesis
MKRIGMFVFDYPLGCLPSVINSVLLFAHEGYEVHIFVDARTLESTPIRFNNDNIAVHAIDIAHRDDSEAQPLGGIHKLARPFSVEGALGKLNLHQTWLKELTEQTFPRLYDRLSYRRYRLFHNRGTSTEKLERQTSDFFPSLFEFANKTVECINDTYACLVGVDVKGLIAATLVAQNRALNKRPPVIYFHMELLLESHVRTFQQRVLKALERVCTDLCYFVVIQDKNRGAYFAEDNNVPEAKLVYVPISGLREPYRGRSDYLREQLGIGPDKRILLHAGGIGSWFMCLELAEAANNWGDDLVLVLHGPKPHMVDTRYLDRIKRAAPPEKVYISLNPVEWEMVPDLIASADIGLLFYKETDPNFLEIARSSNRLVQYLQVGLPIITIDFPSLNELLKECRCGESTGDPNEIGGLAYKILSDYGTYRNHSFKCYTERYKITNYFNEVLEKIRQIS